MHNTTFNFGGGLQGEYSTGAGEFYDGARALHFHGIVSANAFAFSSQENMNPPAGAGKVTMWIRGTATGKTLSVSLGGSTASGKPGRAFNFGNLTGEATFQPENSHKYAGSVNLPNWTKITLDISTWPAGAGAIDSDNFKMKVGKTGNYDIYLDEIRYEP